jgi:membrane protease YdiL (CAAX protease family)
VTVPASKPTRIDTPPAPSAPLSIASISARWVELLAIFFGIPALVAAYVDPARRFDGLFNALGLEAIVGPDVPRQRVLMPVLILFTAVILVVLLRDRTFSNHMLWNRSATRTELPRILGLFAFGAAGLLGLAWALNEYTPILTRGDGASAFLFLPREAPIILLIIAIGYPWVSCYPQEITHRAFFFHRYRAVLPGRWSMIVVNAVAFSWLHAPFWNLTALALTLPAGVLFAWTYDRTRSTLAVTIEHAIYGWWVFFTGLGWFVYAGSIGT